MSNLATTTPNGMAKAAAATEIIAGMGVTDLGQVFAKSGLFADVRDASQAIVKILAGREAGIGPFAAMTGIHIIKGKPSMGYQLLGACVKRSGRHDYAVRERTDRAATVEFFRDGKSLGSLRVTIEEATRMGLAGNDNYRKQPATMLFARAMSQGVRTFCPEVTGGPMYTPDELGATVNSEGEPVGGDVPPDVAPPATTPRRSRAADAIADAPPPPIETTATEPEPPSIPDPPCGFADVGDWYCAMVEKAKEKGLTKKDVDAAIKSRGFSSYVAVPEAARRELWAALCAN